MKRSSTQISAGSSLILTIVLICITILSLSVLSFLYLQRVTGQLSVYINQAGYVRGGIQRTFKFESFGIDASEQVEEVNDKLLNLGSFIKEKTMIFSSTDYMQYVEVKNLWDSLRNFEKTSGYLAATEVLWQKTDSLVCMIENRAHTFINYQFIFSFTVLFSLLLLILIFYLIIRIVRRNLEKKAAIDPLTSLYNRNYLPTTFRTIQNKNKHENIAIMIIDIDFFKKVNDTYGHDAGDEILKVVASVLKKNTRESDGLFRYGGEEFLLISPFSDVSKLMQYAERLRTAVAAEHSKETSVTVSIGIGHACNEKRFSFNHLILSADAALYTAKSTGRNKTVINENCAEPMPASEPKLNG